MEFDVGLNFGLCQIRLFFPASTLHPPILPFEYFSINYCPKISNGNCLHFPTSSVTWVLAVCERLFGTMATVPDAWDDDWEKLADVRGFHSVPNTFKFWLTWSREHLVIQSPRQKPKSHELSEELGMRKRTSSYGNPRMCAKSTKQTIANKQC